MTGALRFARLACAPLVLCALLRSVPSCSSESIVLATLPVTDAGTPTAPVRCTTLADCPSGTSFCSKTSCTDTTGTCALYPTYCDATEAPVCGCDDGITYFNDCLRQANGVAASTEGPCGFEEATPCGDQVGPCPDVGVPVSCAELYGFKDACQANVPGSCWVLPATCPTPPPGADRWNACTTDDTCVDTCTAITTGGAYRRAPQCSPPPGP